MSEEKEYQPVYENIEDWPIHKLSQDRRAFVEEIEQFTTQRLVQTYKNDLDDVLAATMFTERIRIKEEPWKVDPPNEKLFWNKIRKRLVNNTLLSKNEVENSNQEALGSIINRYAEEIVSTFNVSTFLFARRFLTFSFNRLLNTAANSGIRGIISSRYNLKQRLKTHGDIETIQALFKKGTIVIVPTHISNLDSIMIGYTMDAVLGFPSFSYGAGLNLYNSGAAAFFMNRMGTYRVDRRKKNAIYLETLKAMSNLSIQRGTNSLFFPGGTRSRSGAIENKLKLGLLGTAVEAQRAMCEKGQCEKVFIVPLIVSYHFVLEAGFLVKQHLQLTGKERYYTGRDESTSFREWLKFVWQLFSQKSDIIFSFGQPFDVLGNAVDANGASFDKFGNELKIQDYFSYQGEVTADLQREAEYTKILSDRIVERFYKDNIVLSSHVVAFAAFNMLLRHNDKLDLYGVMRLPTDDFVFPRESFMKAVEKLREILRSMESAGNVKLSAEIHLPINELVEDGIKNLGFYHVKKPLTFDKAGDIVSNDFDVLYFYHNRLENYGLQRKVRWENFPLRVDDGGEKVTNED